MKFLLLATILFFSFFGLGQNEYPYGKFPVRSIDKADYNNGGVQNWDIIQNNDHFIYVANNAGILEYNGSSWFKFELENKEHPRSFDKNEAGEIFVGGQGEFGVIQYDETGKAYCKKLSEQVDSVDFNDIWKVVCIEEKTYFVARKFVFIYDKGEILTIKAPESNDIIKSSQLGNNIICMVNKEGIDHLFLLRGTKFFSVKNSEGVAPRQTFSEKGVDYIIDSEGGFHAFIVNGNNYKLKHLDRKLQLNRVVKIRSMTMNDNIIIVGSDGNGVEVFDLHGKFLRSFREEDGLQNLRIHSAMFDQYNNLWLCNDNGISFIEMSSALTKFDSNDGVTAGATEDIYFRDSTIHLVTHSDIFEGKISNSRFKFEPIEVFGMEVFQVKHFTFSDGKEIDLAIVNDGIYSLAENNSHEVVAQLVYAWDLFQSTSNPDRIWIGLDGDGVGSLLYTDGEFEYEGNYPNTFGDVRSIVEKDNKVYYTVKNDGVHLLDTTKQQDATKVPGLKQYNDPGLAYEQFTLGLFQGDIYVGTRNGLYTLENNLLTPSEFENGKFAESRLLIHRIFNDNDEKMWMVVFHDSGTEKEKSEIGYLVEKDGEKVWFSSPFNQIKDDVIFSLKKAPDGIYWMGGVKGVYAYNQLTNATNSQAFSVFINRVYLNKDEDFLYHTNYANKTNYTLDYHHNTVNFEFGANAYLGGLINEYSYYLEGEEDSWSAWSERNHAEFQRLAEGEYTFHVKAKNFYGNESEETVFTFTISPPWYRTWWAYLIYAVLFILLIYVIIRLSLRRVKAQNERLEQIVKERTAEIAEQNSTLEHQKAEIQEKTNDILDSIKYAERIQTAILPPEEEMNQLFEGENFVLFKPKDIVSGDFYWAERFGSEVIFSAVDCTGHGVPGAFVSIVGFNALNRTVNEFDLRKPGEILDKLTALVVGTFSKSESQIKDGMDIALCNINYENNTLMYAGANNPLILIRNGELTEIKANKQPIGEFDNRVPFTTHEIKLEKGDCIYVYSDGYADQFGGPKGKKFKGKALKQLLLDINDLSMDDQQVKMNEMFESWKGNFEQLDDVCLIGVRI